ncbi:MAG: hypothetical protein H8E43_01205 [Planctomycetia bacterium]|nr:hypothetical protein [Planctomycetia bacterium]MBL6915094.1 hypothetical protein [Planctomycetota bacterium]HCW43799.1 hypothetical protein [Planctomycetota bacterium]
MSTGFFKSNEKVIMTLLLLILAPTFAATGLIQSFFEGGNPDSYVVFGESIDAETFIEARRGLSEALWVNNIRRFGPYGAQVSRRYQSATVDDVLRHLVFQHDLNERGIEPSMERKAEEIRNAALDIIAWHQVMDQSGWEGTYQDNFPGFSVKRNDPNFIFKTADYKAVFADSNFWNSSTNPLSIKDFEDSIVRNLRTQELLNAVTSSVVVSEQEAFSDFSASYEKRILDVVQIPGDDFIDEARESATIEEFEKYYQDNADEFVLNNRLVVEVARINRNNLIASTNYEPTAEEIEAKYSEDRDVLYRVRRPDGYVPPEDADPEDDYRPLAEVFERVVRSFNQEKAQVVEGDLLQSALDALTEFRNQGETVELSQVFPEGLDYVEIVELDPFTQREINTLESQYRNPAAYGEFFTRERNTPGAVQPGDLYSSIATNSQGNFLIRVKEMEPQRQMTYEEGLEDIIKATEVAKAKELASSTVEGWIEQIRSGEEGVTLESITDANNYSIYTMDPVTRSQSFNLKINNVVISAARDILTAAFDIQEVGQVVGPVGSDADKAVYLVRLSGMGDADLELFSSLKESTERRLLLDKQRAILEAYEAELMESANIMLYQEDGGAVSREELQNQSEEGSDTSG